MRTLFSSFLLALLIFFHFAFGQAIPFQHVNSWGGAGMELGRTLDLLPDGSRIISGDFNGVSPFSLGPYTLSNPAGSSTMFIARLDAAHNVQWVQHTTGNLTNIHAAAVSRNGNIVGTGNITGTNIFGNDTLTPQSQYGVFLTCLSSSGNFLWNKVITDSAGNVIPGCVVTDDANNIYVSGHYFRKLNIDGIQLNGRDTSAGASSDIFVAKFNPAGNVIWAKTFGSLQPENNTQITIDSLQNLYLSGRHFDGFQIGGFNLSASGAATFLSRLDTAGNVIWANSFAGNNANVARQLACDSIGNLYVSWNVESDININGTTITFPNPFGQVLLTKFSSAGNLQWYRRCLDVNILDPFAVAVTPDGEEIALAGNHYWSFQTNTTIEPGLIVPPIYGYTIIFDSSGSILRWYGLGNGAGAVVRDVAFNSNRDPVAFGYFSGDILNWNDTLNSQGLQDLLLMMGRANYNTVKGKIFYDNNGNGLPDPSENGILNVFLQASAVDPASNSDANGNFTLFTDSGAWQISIPSPPLYHSLPASLPSGNFVGFHQTSSGNDIPAVPIPGIPDLEVWVTPRNIPRPFRKHDLEIHYRNVGTVTIPNPVVRLIHPNIYSLYYAYPPGYAYSNDTLTWTLSSLAPGQSGSMFMQFTPDSVLAIPGANFTFTAMIEPVLSDSTPHTNVDNYSDFIRASYDPNDKRVNYDSIFPLPAYQAGEYLDYTIRFQNTGNDTAFSVLLRDTLDANVNPATIRVVASSHPYTLNYSNRVLTFAFPGIELPDSHVNEFMSHGFIRFRVQAVPGLGIGDEIQNSVAIYFDVNPPVITNTVVSRIDTVLLTAPEMAISGMAWEVFPNPAQDVLSVRMRVDEHTEAALQLMDLHGQTLIRRRLALRAGEQQIKMQVHDLPAGLYFLRLETQRGSWVRKVLILD